LLCQISGATGTEAQQMAAHFPPVVKIL
jgi:hypothetical protein